jgi:hypothetical protein
MKKIDLGQTIQIVANIGVIAGLIFVGMQLRQERQIASIQGAESSAEGLKQWAELVTSNSQVWVKGRNGEPLSETEQAEFDALARAYNFDMFLVWLRSTQLPSPRDPASFISEAAEEFYRYPGLLTWRRNRQAETRARGDSLGEPPGPTPTGWDTLMDEKIREIEQAPGLSTGR